MAHTSANPSTPTNPPSWKDTPTMGMKKDLLLDIANVKEAHIAYLRKKNKERKAALKEVRAALAAAQATQVAVQPVVVALIPRPCGTGGCGGFNLANAMGVDTKYYHEIQDFVRSLVNMSTLKKSVLWKNQPSDEIHKIFSVTTERYPIMKKFEYNWATAEMAKLYLRNSCAQEARARKARATPEASTDAAANPPNNDVGTSQPAVDPEQSSDPLLDEEEE